MLLQRYLFVHYSVFVFVFVLTDTLRIPYSLGVMSETPLRMPHRDVIIGKLLDSVFNVGCEQNSLCQRSRWTHKNILLQG
jgi:hypothetical protein